MADACKSRPADHSLGAQGREPAMEADSSRYRETYARWQRDPQGFWAEAAQDIDWIEPARHVLGGRGSQAAIIYDSPLANAKRTITYDRLLTEVQVLAAILRDLGVGQ